MPLVSSLAIIATSFVMLYKTIQTYKADKKAGRARGLFRDNAKPFKNFLNLHETVTLKDYRMGVTALFAVVFFFIIVSSLLVLAFRTGDQTTEFSDVIVTLACLYYFGFVAYAWLWGTFLFVLRRLRTLHLNDTLSIMHFTPVAPFLWVYLFLKKTDADMTAVNDR